MCGLYEPTGAYSRRLDSRRSTRTSCARRCFVGQDGAVLGHVRDNSCSSRRVPTTALIDARPSGAYISSRRRCGVRLHVGERGPPVGRATVAAGAGAAWSPRRRCFPRRATGAWIRRPSSTSSTHLTTALAPDRPCSVDHENMSLCTRLIVTTRQIISDGPLDDVLGRLPRRTRPRGPAKRRVMASRPAPISAPTPHWLSSPSACTVRGLAADRRSTRRCAGVIPPRPPRSRRRAPQPDPGDERRGGDRLERLRARPSLINASMPFAAGVVPARALSTSAPTRRSRPRF